jgi:3-isopropylmalate/(R)-2-methylmalate dehydratase small subunit
MQDGTKVEFPIDPFNKKCLVEGIDPLGYLLRFNKEIVEYEDLRNQSSYSVINTLD